MAKVCAPPNEQDHPINSPPRQVDEQAGVRSLVEENARLRELVVQLTALVIKNAVDRR
jgi:hypothetical protein